jgi:hypothetical protein
MTVMIEAIRTYILTYSGLTANSPVYVDFLGTKPATQYAVGSLPGAKTIEKYINGGSRRQFPFALEAAFSTADDAARIAASGFFEGLAEWFDSQTEAGVFPTLGTGKTAEKIEANNWVFLSEQGQSDTGIYQIQCILEYEQQP